MRIEQRSVPLTAAAVLIAVVCHAGEARFTDGPGGRLHLLRTEEPNREMAGFIASQGFNPLFAMIAESQGSRRWFRFAAEWDTSFVWRERTTIVATMKDGREIEASDIYVTTPGARGRPMALGTTTRMVNPSELDRRTWRGGAPAVPVFVAFPDVKMELGDVASVQVRKRKVTAAAPTVETGRSP